MGDCSVCKNLTKEELKQKTCVFTSRRDVLYFLLNTLLNVTHFRGNICFCSRKEQKCAICNIRNEFYSVEYDLYDNTFDFYFLSRIHSGLFAYRRKMIVSDRCVCLILNHKFAYFWKDRCNGEKHRVSLEDASAKEKLDQMEGQIPDIPLFRIVPEFRIYNERSIFLRTNGFHYAKCSNKIWKW